MTKALRICSNFFAVRMDSHLESTSREVKLYAQLVPRDNFTFKMIVTAYIFEITDAALPCSKALFCISCDCYMRNTSCLKIEMPAAPVLVVKK